MSIFLHSREKMGNHALNFSIFHGICLSQQTSIVRVSVCVFSSFC